jgi:homoserine dehydrogenase
LSIGIGIAGTGEVGGEVVRILRQKSGLLMQRCGVELEIVKASYRSRRPPPDLLPDEVITTSLDEVVEDPRAQIVVELLGGIDDAYRVITGALQRGKSVITANKAVLAAHGGLIFARARESGAALGFEAAVAGAIPIISSLRNSFVAETFHRFYGILNGTTNFMLSRMQEGMPYSEALRLAQEKGYAEADPSLDVEGTDAAQKLALLSSLLFNTPIPPNVFTQGITDLTENDIRYASDLGYTVKLIASARRLDEGLELSVRPTLIPSGHELAHIQNEYNALFIKGDNIGQSMFYGLGAGGRPTASMVVSDLVRVARSLEKGTSSFPVFFNSEMIPLVPIEEHRSPFYLRFGVMDQVGILAKISTILAEHGISLSGAWAKTVSNNVISLVVATHQTRSGDVYQAVKKIDASEGLTSGSSPVLPINDLRNGEK